MDQGRGWGLRYPPGSNLFLLRHPTYPTFNPTFVLAVKKLPQIIHYASLGLKEKRCSERLRVVCKKTFVKMLFGSRVISILLKVYLIGRCALRYPLGVRYDMHYRTSQFSPTEIHFYFDTIHILYCQINIL